MNYKERIEKILDTTITSVMIMRIASILGEENDK